MNYGEPQTKQIKLPSGAECTVRRQTKIESIKIGQPPAFFIKEIREAKRREKETGKAEDLPETERSPEQDQQLLEFLTQQTKVLLVNCCREIRQAGRVFKIKDCDPEQAGPEELSWAMVTEPDVQEIIKAINELAETDREAVATFPDEKGKGTA